MKKCTEANSCSLPSMYFLALHVFLCWHCMYIDKIVLLLADQNRNILMNIIILYLINTMFFIFILCKLVIVDDLNKYC